MSKAEGPDDIVVSGERRSWLGFIASPQDLVGIVVGAAAVTFLWVAIEQPQHQALVALIGGAVYLALQGLSTWLHRRDVAARKMEIRDEHKRWVSQQASQLNIVSVFLVSADWNYIQQRIRVEVAFYCPSPEGATLTSSAVDRDDASLGPVSLRLTAGGNTGAPVFLAEQGRRSRLELKPDAAKTTFVFEATGPLPELQLTHGTTPTSAGCEICATDQSSLTCEGPMVVVWSTTDAPGHP